MDLSLAGKRAIVTGGSAGIGLACARVLSQEGVAVVIAARDPSRLDGAARLLATKGGARVQAVSADLSRASDVTRVVAAAREILGGVDILINNAGSAMGGPFHELDDSAFLDAWQLKLLGYIRMVRAVLPLMKAQRDGRIVNIIGGAARNPSYGFMPGSTVNAAILNFTRGLVHDLAADGIRINAVSPGSTDTERAEQLLEARARTAGQPISVLRVQRNGQIPLRRLVRPEEIAYMAAFLASDLAASTTGAEVVIDGGASRSL